jgi:hypothetical protein
MARKRRSFSPPNIFGFQTLSERYKAAASVNAIADSLIVATVHNGKGVIILPDDIETYRGLKHLAAAVQLDTKPPHLNADLLLDLPAHKVMIKDLRAVGKLLQRIDEYFSPLIKHEERELSL